MNFKTRIGNIDSQSDLQHAVELLQSGELVAIPTETVYGLAGLALNEDALLKIFRSKERPQFDPLILHLPYAWVESHCDKAQSTSRQTLTALDRLQEKGVVSTTALTAKSKTIILALMKNFWPGPLTLVLPKQSLISDLATSGRPSVALRVPAHEGALKLLKALDAPLAAPSANRFGRISPTSAQDVLEELDGKIPFILDGGPCSRGIESTIIAPLEALGLDANALPETVQKNSSFVLLRPGALPREEIERFTGPLLLASEVLRSTTHPHGEISPGMLLGHYAPRKKMLRFKTAQELPEILGKLEPMPKSIGILFWSTPPEALSQFLEINVETQSLAETTNIDADPLRARNLFRCLRALDHSSAELLFCEIPQEAQSPSGLRHAIVDRLTRASHSS